jgi:deoxycytidylate deaminase
MGTVTDIGSRHIKWLDRTIKVAATSTYSRWYMGATIVRGGAVLSTGVNSAKNAPVLMTDADIENGRGSYHAEIAALKKCGDPNNATIYIARLTPSGNVGCAHPCANCMKHLIAAGIRQVIYTDHWGKIGVVKL